MNPKMTAKDAAEFLDVTVQSVHQTLKKKNLPFSKSKNRVYFSFETSRQVFDLPFEPKTMAFQIVKGGTGKTSLAFNFAIRANLYGARVLCIDLDQQGNLTDYLGFDASDSGVMVDIIEGSEKFEDCIVNISPGLDLLPSRIENAVIDNLLMLKKKNLGRVYKEMFARVKNQYDLIIIDCPPALGHSVTAAALASDQVIAPVNPDRSAIKGLQITSEEIANAGEENSWQGEVRVVLNKFDKRTSLSHETLESLMKHKKFSKYLFPTYIGNSQEFSNTVAANESIFDAVKDTAVKTDIDLLTKDILDLDELKDRKKRLKRNLLLDEEAIKKKAQVPPMSETSDVNPNLQS